jgi:hypothetical protein
MKSVERQETSTPFSSVLFVNPFILGLTIVSIGDIYLYRTFFKFLFELISLCTVIYVSFRNIFLLRWIRISYNTCTATERM